jgi:hypothetical protein
MAIVSRLQLDHPALNTAGGSGLHTSIENLYIRIGDNLNSRFFEAENLANAASVDLEHNFKTAFNTLRFDLYLWDTGTDELTLVSDPDLANYPIVATPSFTTTKVRVTNNSGSIQDLVLVVTHGTIDSKKVDFVIRNVAGNVTLQEGKYHLVDTSAARTLTLPDPATTKRPIWIKDKTGSASTNPITVARFGSEKIETVAASFSLNSDLGAWTLVTDGTDWFIL